MKSVRELVLFALVLAAASSVDAVDYYVDQNSGGHIPPYTNWTQAATDIQSAVNAASANSTVWVAPGCYTATNAVLPAGGTNIVEISKPLTLRSSEGAEVTSIDGEGTNRCIFVSYNLAANNTFVLDGFSVTNAWGNRAIRYYSGPSVNYNLTTKILNCVIAENQTGGIIGTCIANDTFSIVVSNCVVRDNRFWGNGAGLYWDARAAFTVVDSRFENNWATNDTRKGGAIYVNALYRDVVIANCEFRGNRCGEGGDSNTGGGAINFERVHLTMRNCLFTENYGRYGGGVFVQDNWQHDLEFDNCTFVGNHGSQGDAAGGLHIRGAASPSYLRMRNCILYYNENSAPNDPQRNLYVGNAFTSESYTNNCTTPTNEIKNFYVNGNIDGAPGFADLGGLNLRLSQTSSCLNTGTNLPWMDGALDLDGNRRVDASVGIVDRGCYEYRYVGTAITIQ